MNLHTVGISPKVLGPFLLQLAGACVLFFMGEGELATTLVTTAVATGAVGYIAPVGIVIEEEEVIDLD